MNLNQYKENICRICLDDDIWLDWNRSLTQFNDITYKDCYYKYSQLEHFATDPFPQMLCQNCCKALTSTHALILKLLESHKVLQKTFSLSSQFQDELRTSTSIDSRVDNNQYLEFETILVEKKKNVKSKTKRKRSKRMFEESLSKPLNNTLEITAPSTKFEGTTISKVKSPKILNDNKSEMSIEKDASEEAVTHDWNSIEYDVMDDQKIEEETAYVEPEGKTKYNEELGLCSFCSKILRNKKALLVHEETHIENRERKVTCKICDLKFYNKTALYAHMAVHTENRERRHKCEFCSKAFFGKGGLNVHRRIHLGQMIPCSLCSKQFFRQIDLKIHMNSHSATAINSETKKQSKYFVRCPYCDKTIRSTTFRSHRAAHLNEPLVKCSICDKEYFSRSSCVVHVKKVHQKSNEEYNNFIVVYTNNRMSHLYLEQKADIQVKTD